jgi:hypothetical protein
MHTRESKRARAGQHDRTGGTGAPSAGHDAVLGLQRTAGNRAVASVLSVQRDGPNLKGASTPYIVGGQIVGTLVKGKGDQVVIKIANHSPFGWLQFGDGS